MDRFKVSTKTSLFKPVEIEVDGQVYSRATIPPAIIDEVSTYEETAKGGDMKSIVKQLHLLTDIPEDVAMQIDIRDLERMMKFVSARIFNAETYEEIAEKKASKAEARRLRQSKEPSPASSDTKNSST